MPIVSNTTPIISLAKINKLDLLEKIFGEIIVSKGVYTELTSKAEFKEVNYIKSSSFIKVVDLKNEFAVRIIQKAFSLDRGESESIILAEEYNADLLLMDEKKGRNAAISMDIKIAGTLGILLEAKKMGLVTEIKPFMDKLIENNIRISNKLYREILETHISHPSR
jgi:hypothetical protein